MGERGGMMRREWRCGDSMRGFSVLITMKQRMKETGEKSQIRTNWQRGNKQRTQTKTRSDQQQINRKRTKQIKIFKTHISCP
jgi:hypothetical protein